MKFAKELDIELVPEWRVKYIDYKQGKRELKAFARALRKSRSSGEQQPQKYPKPGRAINAVDDGGHSSRSAEVATSGSPLTTRTTRRENEDGYPIPYSRKRGTDPEQQLLTGGYNGQDQRGMARLTRYGSIIGSPPIAFSASFRDPGPPSLELPGPALNVVERASDSVQSRIGNSSDETTLPRGCRPGANEAGETRALKELSHTKKHLHRSASKSGRSLPVVGMARPAIRRLLTFGSATFESQHDVPLDAYREVDTRKEAFFEFLDHELDKCEEFYKLKEEEATERLKVLREQLHIMRDHRNEDLVMARAGKIRAKQDFQNAQFLYEPDRAGERAFSQPWARVVGRVMEAARSGRFGKKTEAMENLATPRGLQTTDGNRDYVRRSATTDIPYRTAKRKLKVAMQEFYRGLELLKSYTILNRKGFRKINKKFDKTASARPAGRYMLDNVNKAYFVQSDVLDGHIRTVEDLYARYFEGGNHKIAAGKLRAKSNLHQDYTPNVFRNGLFVAAGTVLAIQGLVFADQLLHTSNVIVRVNTSYLLQIYGGYFLILLLMFLFCLCCRFWTVAKVNYVFIFEFDTRHVLDWRQLAELPCFLLFLLGLILWLNFTRYGEEDLYIFYPIVLIGATIFLLFLPAPILYYRSRFWFLYSNWRLFFSSLYPVEFRDFFLGDMVCSLTFSMGNIALLFCLYAREWDTPEMCNSSHSRLLGFFATLPGIWRSLQCIRRFIDTRNAFPHLVNCGKYAWTILFYMSLSVYRIDKTPRLRAFFIFCATINSVYCSIWDVVMDWSLIDPLANHRFLRENLAFKQTWIYYAAIVVDPILRFNWIFYAIYANDLQHSAILSFIIALTEVFRRGIWTIFRVENEHCTNVGRFRASRDVPLPYHLDKSDVDNANEGIVRRTSDDEEQRHGISPYVVDPSSASGVDASRMRTEESSSSPLQRGRVKPSPLMQGLNRVGSKLHMAHAQDFERKKESNRDVNNDEGDSSDDAEDDDGDIEEVVKDQLAAVSRVAEAEERGTETQRNVGLQSKNSSRTAPDRLPLSPGASKTPSSEL